MREAAKNLKIQLSRFETLERLSRVGLDVDQATRAALQDGKILRALLRQRRLSPRSIAHQVLTLTAVSEHWFSDLPPGKAVDSVESLVRLTRQKLPDLFDALNRGECPAVGWRPKVEELATKARAEVSRRASPATSGEHLG
jgi:F-type H+-transporting ATPase subunit alpha